MEGMLGMKELYDVYFKTIEPFKIGNKTFEKGEPIAFFDRVQIGILEPEVKLQAAQGGYKNQVRVLWEETNAINLVFKQGIFSKTHLALLSNSELIEKAPNTTEVSKTEELETDENGRIVVKYVPLENSLIIYGKDGEKLSFEQEDNKVFNLNEAFKDVFIYYRFLYEKQVTVLEIGNRLLSGFVELEGKTYLKNDQDGMSVTGIIRIPKLKIVPNLTLKLGKDASPIVSNFKGIGYPVGVKGREKVATLEILSDDIDADLY